VHWQLPNRLDYCCAKANTVNPEWRMYGWTALTQDCREQFRRINLHWHDLRHEYASRLVERCVPLSQVRDLLGHASIATTERYDNQQLEGCRSQRESWNRVSSSIHRRSDQGRSFAFL
jgi:integrase